MNTCKKRQRKGNIVICAIIISLIATTVLAGALTKTPYHAHSSGVKLTSESHFVGNVPGTGEYKATKGKYIKQAWVQINEGGEQRAYAQSKVVDKKSTTVTFASANCINNPLKEQTFPYGWKYQ